MIITACIILAIQCRSLAGGIFIEFVVDIRLFEANPTSQFPKIIDTNVTDEQSRDMGR
jgi:hypothetical protein